MATNEPPSSSLPASMGPGARPIQPGENPGNVIQEISEIRSHYKINVDADALNIAYELNGQHRHYRLPFGNMPLAGLQKRFAYGGDMRAKLSGIMLIDTIRAVENKTGTQLSQQEAEGMAYYVSKKTAVQIGAQYGAIVAGYLLAWRGRRVMKFPFRSPKPMERYDAFPLRRLPILSGTYARFMWHVTRANTYAILALFAASPLAGSFGNTLVTVGLYRDERTRDVVTRVRDFNRIKGNQASAGVAAQSTPQARQAQQNQITSPDDVSPSAWSENAYTPNFSSESPGDTTFTDGSTDTGALSDATMQQRQEQQVRQSPSNAWGRAANKSSPNPGSNQSGSSSDFFFDDASPTAGNDPDMSTSQPYARRPAGNSWERIRRGSNAETQQSQSRSTAVNRNQRDQTYENREDSFSFSRAQEDSQLAKEQAQRDFDAMLDRERRQGGSPNFAQDVQARANSEAPTSSESAWGRVRRG